MSTETLQDLLAVVADELGGPGQEGTAARAWARARQLRRRRSTIGASLAVLLVAVPAGVVQWTDSQTARPGPSAAGPSRLVFPGEVYVDHLPAELTLRTPTGWPANLDPPVDAPALTSAPMTRPTLVFRPGPGNRIYFYGSVPAAGGTSQWARFDSGSEVQVNAVGPAGLVAFAQDGGYIVVDPATGEAHPVPLPDRSQEVTWLPVGEYVLLTHGITGTIGEADGVVGTVTLSDLYGLVAVGGGAIPSSAVLDQWTPTTLTLIAGGAGLRVRRSDQLGAPVDSYDVTVPDGYPLEMIAGRPWRIGSRIAQAITWQVGDGWHNATVVVDERTRAVTHLLDLGESASIVTGVMGWLHPDAVLVATATQGVLAWDLTDGSVTVALPYAEGSLSIGPYDGWSRVYR